MQDGISLYNSDFIRPIHYLQCFNTLHHQPLLKRECVVVENKRPMSENTQCIVPYS